MASLTGASIASSYTSLLKLNGNTDSLVAGNNTNAIQVVDGDGTGSALYLNTDRVGVGGQPVGKVLIHDTSDATDDAGMDKFAINILNQADDNNEELGIGFRISSTAPSSSISPGGAITFERTASASRGALHFKTKGSTGALDLDTRMSIASDGAVSVVGALSKGSGSFKIDHPLESKKDTHHLVHSFVEAPQADNIYRGKVNLSKGAATINIDEVAGMTDGTFVALNTDVQCFTSNESDWDAVKGSVSSNILTITCQNENSTATISWLVVGERQDKHMIETNWTDDNGKVIVEPLKVQESSNSTEEKDPSE